MRRFLIDKSVTVEPMSVRLVRLLDIPIALVVRRRRNLRGPRQSWGAAFPTVFRTYLFLLRLGFLSARRANWLLLAASRRWFVLEVLPRFLARVPPVDLRPFPVGLAVPSLGFPLQHSQGRNPPRAQALAGVHAEFDLGLIEPTQPVSYAPSSSTLVSTVSEESVRSTALSYNDGAEAIIISSAPWP